MHRKLTLLLLPFLAAAHLTAAEFIGTNIYHISAEQTVADEQWVTAGLIKTEGTFENDLFLMSGNVLELSGTYRGNIWGMASAGAGMTGAAERNVRLMGKSVRIDGPVGGNVLAIGETIMITTNAVIQGNVRLYGASIILEGHIHGGANITSARVLTLGGTMDGTANVFAPDILFSRGTTIGGDLLYTANKELFPDEGMVQGSLTREAPKAEPLFTRARLVSRGLWFIAALMVGIPFIALFPMTTAMAAQLAKTSPFKCLAVGFVASGALPIFGIMSISSLIGVPLGSLILASWGILIYLSRIIAALLLGTMILRTIGNSIARIILAMAIGLAVIYLSSLIPALGMPVQLAVIWIGMGSLLLALMQKRQLIIQVPQKIKDLEALKNEQNKSEEEAS